MDSASDEMKAIEAVIRTGKFTLLNLSQLNANLTQTCHNLTQNLTPNMSQLNQNLHLGPGTLTQNFKPNSTVIDIDRNAYDYCKCEKNILVKMFKATSIVPIQEQEKMRLLKTRIAKKVTKLESWCKWLEEVVIVFSFTQNSIPNLSQFTPRLSQRTPKHAPQTVTTSALTK